jgi:hypothetical protein
MNLSSISGHGLVYGRRHGTPAEGMIRWPI